MNSDKLIDKLELYSNAIVGFMVAQSIAFSFTFGTNTTFSCEFTRYHDLASALILHFVLSTALSSAALHYISRHIRELSSENQQIVAVVFKAKACLVVLFALIPIGLLVFFGVLGDITEGRCKLLG